MSHAPLPAFQQYQRAFTAFIRDPAHHKAPKGANRSGMAVYKEIVYNNLESSVAACFPVCKQVLGKRAWAKLVRGFMREHASSTPIFREIPAEFLSYVQVQTDFQTNLPPYLYPLAHYEWVELAIATLDVAFPAEREASGDWLSSSLILNPALSVLSYQYPVQQISPKRKPTEALEAPVHLLVFRNRQHQVQFMEVNAVTARLVNLLAAGEDITLKQALQQLAHELQHPDIDAIYQFGVRFIQDLYQQQVVLGAKI